MNELISQYCIQYIHFSLSARGSPWQQQQQQQRQQEHYLQEQGMMEAQYLEELPRSQLYSSLVIPSTDTPQYVSLIYTCGREFFLYVECCFVHFTLLLLKAIFKGLFYQPLKY